jgi:signal transduction histidine kinase
MAEVTTSTKVRRWLSGIRSDWVEIGGLGRLAVAGVVLAFAVTLILGFSITRAARGHLLVARAAMVSAIVDDLPAFPESPDSAGYAAFDVAVRVNLLGGETVRVKVWARDGMILYSDAPELVGKRFELPAHAARAFDGVNETHVSDLSDPAHAFDRGHGELIEFYVLSQQDGGGELIVVEVEQDASGLNQALSLIARNVWLSITIGLLAIGLVMAVGVAARGRELNRKRRQAEELLVSSFQAQEDERRRVVSALHDDIGQPMYRLLYGIEGSRAKLDSEDPVAIELSHLGNVVREMDGTLRKELRLLHFELAADAGISTAMAELVDLTSAETDLDVRLDIDLAYEPAAIERTEIYRAAREAITNVRKHADAHRVDISIYGEGDTIVLNVIDDGKGAGVSDDPGLGLSTTRQRFKALDGDVTLDQTADGRTCFRAWLPVRQATVG